MKLTDWVPCVVPGPLASRAARVAASVASFAALVSHVSAGGSMPGWAGVIVPWVLAVAACVLLAGHTLSLTRLSVSVILSQLLFHVLFVLGAPPAGAGFVSSGHRHHAGMIMSPLPSSALTTEALCADPLMWGAHAFAALVTIVALYRGERAFAALLATARDIASWARRVVARVLDAPVFPSARRAVAQPGNERFVPTSPHLTVLRRRGPPSLVVL